MVIGLHIRYLFVIGLRYGEPFTLHILPVYGILVAVYSHMLIYADTATLRRHCWLSGYAGALLICYTATGQAACFYYCRYVFTPPLISALHYQHIANIININITPLFAITIMSLFYAATCRSYCYHRHIISHVLSVIFAYAVMPVRHHYHKHAYHHYYYRRIV